MQRTLPAKVQVMYRGVPVPGCVVVLHPIAEVADSPDAPRSTAPTGETGADGTASLTSYMAGDGAPEGDYTVTLLCRPRTGERDGEPTYGPDRFGGRFVNAASSPLKQSVKKGDSMPIRIDVTD